MTTITGRTVTAGDGVSLHAESTGGGTPLLFLRDFASDHRIWEPQVRSVSASYRCVTYAARGYPPPAAPADPAYSRERAVDDEVAVPDGLGIPAGHVIGLSKGGFAALHLTVRLPGQVPVLIHDRRPRRGQPIMITVNNCHIAPHIDRDHERR